MSNEKKQKKSIFRKSKKLYVPDPEIMEYMNAKKEAQIAADNAEAANIAEAVEVEKRVDSFEEISAVESLESADDIIAAIESIDAEKAVSAESQILAETLDDVSEDSNIPLVEKEPKKRNKFMAFLHKMIIPHKTDSKKQIAIKSVSIFLVVAIIASIVYLSFYYIQYYSVQAEIMRLQNIYNLNRDSTHKYADGQFSKFDALKAENDDIVGWLSIPDTDIDNPIYQSSDNVFYATHDINRNPNRYGTLFLDYRCKIHPLKLSNNQIVYGHNMREGAMLGTLDEYRKLSFYKKCPTIQFDTLYEQKTYKIFAVMVVSNEADNTFGYSFSPYRANFDSREEFTTWIKHCRERSLFDTDVDVNEYDQILTLSTCCYDFDEARLVIMGRLVRDGEDNTVNTSNAKENSDVLYPGAWYEKKKKPIPKVSG